MRGTPGHAASDNRDDGSSGTAACPGASTGGHVAPRTAGRANRLASRQSGATSTARSRKRLFHLVFESHDGRASGAESEEKREPVSDINTGVLDSLKVLDPTGRLEKRTFFHQLGHFANRASRLYGGRPASRQAFTKGSASMAGSASAVQNPRALNEGCNDKTCAVSAFASSKLPSLTRGATSKL